MRDTTHTTADSLLTVAPNAESAQRHASSLHRAARADLASSVAQTSDQPASVRKVLADCSRSPSLILRDRPHPAPSSQPPLASALARPEYRPEIASTGC